MSFRQRLTTWSARSLARALSAGWRRLPGSDPIDPEIARLIRSLLDARSSQRDATAAALAEAEAAIQAAAALAPAAPPPDPHPYVDGPYHPDVQALLQAIRHDLMTRCQLNPVSASRAAAALLAGHISYTTVTVPAPTTTTPGDCPP